MLLPPAGWVEVVSDYITVPGIDPYLFQDGGQFLVSTAMIHNLELNGPEQKFFDACLISHALEYPTVILEGLKRTNYADGLCYCTVPKIRWTTNMETISPPPLKVFSVYVNPADAGLLVLDWDWRIVGPGATGIPYRWQRDFERIVWPTS